MTLGHTGLSYFYLVFFGGDNKRYTVCPVM